MLKRSLDASTGQSSLRVGIVLKNYFIGRNLSFVLSHLLSQIRLSHQYADSSYLDCNF